MAVTNTNKHWALQRKLLMNTKIGFNAEVYRHFKDILDDDTTTTATRKTLRDSILINSKDSRTTAMFKIQYFREQVQQVHLKPTIIGQPKTTFDESVTYKCQVQLNFIQSPQAAPKGYKPIDAQISFRLDETHLTITETKYKALANKIRQEFAPSTIYHFDKGKHICYYRDAERGYDLRVRAASETVGKQVIQKVLDLQNHSFEAKYFNISSPERNSDNNPGNQTILGDSTKKPRWRPGGTVYFAYADLLVHGLDEPITLVAVRGQRRSQVLTV